MRRNSGDYGLSAAMQHRKALGDFDHAKAERLHAHLRNGRHPIMSTKRLQHHDSSSKETPIESSGHAMSRMSVMGMLVTVAGSLFLISYAVVVTAIVNANE
ncbi:hypothetical protein FI667_g3898, partial [Globisporangium splendens]